MWKQFRAAVALWIGWLGTFAGIMALISLLVSGFQVGLRPILAEFLCFYRGLLRPIREALQSIFSPLIVPPEAIELATLYIVLLGLSVRAEFTPLRASLQKKDAPRVFRFLYRTVKYPVVTVRRILKCLFLVPAVFFQPIVDAITSARRTKRDAAINAETLPAVTQGGLPVEVVQAFLRAGVEIQERNNATNLAMFVAFPVAVFLFFVLNQYGVW